MQPRYFNRGTFRWAPRPPTQAGRPKPLDQLRQALGSCPFSRPTEQNNCPYAGRCIRIGELVGHGGLKTTMIHTHALNRGPSGVRSRVVAFGDGGSCSDPHKNAATRTFTWCKALASHQLDLDRPRIRRQVVWRFKP